MLKHSRVVYNNTNRLKTQVGGTIVDESYVQTNQGLITFPTWKQLDSRLEVGFTTRKGGVSRPPFDSMNMGLHVKDEYDDVLANRLRLAEAVQFPLSTWVSGEQVHGAEISIITPEHKGQGAYRMEDNIQGVDGLITNEPGILCTAFFADCVPLFFFDPEASLIGIAHAGWKGTVKQIARRMVDEMINLGATDKQIRVIIGPSISRQMYEVDDAVIRHIPEEWKEVVVQRAENNRYLLDLQQLNMEILLQYGILRHNIDRMNLCTFKMADLFYSHRRDRGKTGRMLGYIGFREK